ncbi:nitroreductase/quinone reductase family protein [Conexibacter woesei]|uniref:Nitroreductase n=1 Tax=Conexibacter woesei (strain DSM 14684 / CCUG 47730 / CIP 108061 / JCM 11494 / NBRC 100937 / ID131577) TaxID=469383 RepID=D3F877_CONWI|nr:nitroreductase/quinone reductase family protein [Conexibacter woesei]ADB48947.1 hypothetical protein Cwoe_0512 [Conexibacter woesei DSM 14684]
MAQKQEARKAKTPGAFSIWMQKKANARVVRKARKGKNTFMGMDILVLNTVGKRTGEPRATPLAWFGDGDGAWISVASGGGSRNPGWYVNLVANPERASIELPGAQPCSVTSETLTGAERDEAWAMIAESQPRIAKYQAKSDRAYPIVRLTGRARHDR